VRFIVGTNADLLTEVQEGRFREDLYYRIQVLATRLPPLSRRTDEIVPWARHMIERRRVEAQRAGPVVLADEAAELLVRAPWPGNLRQLDNAVRRAFVLASADAGAGGDLLTVTAAHMQASLASEGPEGMTPIAAALTQAAHALLDALDAGAQLELDDATIFRAHVLGAAIARSRDVDESFRILRRENLVRNRNHHKTVDRELQRVREFYAALGIAPPRWLVQALTR
jgi:DNA-binding NtrC family response regulator